MLGPLTPDPDQCAARSRTPNFLEWDLGPEAQIRARSDASAITSVYAVCTKPLRGRMPP